MSHDVFGAIHARLAIHREMQVPRDEYLDHMTFERLAAPMFTEIFGPLIGLREQWLQQGATPGELDFSAFRYRQPMEDGVPVNTGFHGGREPKVLEETDEHILAIDRMGRRVRLCTSSGTLPLPLEHPVTGWDDWLEIKPHYQFSEDRFDPDWERVAREHLRAGRVLTVSIPGGFDEPRQLLGEEALCYAYYEQPDLLHDILRTIGETACEVLERVTSAVRIDQLFVHEDMAGKSGPLAGPKQIEEFIAPYYRRAWELAKAGGARLFKQDSDGDIRPVIPAFLEAGVNLMYPMEPAAGVDIVEVREQYGRRLAFIGGLDKFVLQRGRDAIDAELERKIPPMVATGGCVLGLDHRIPNGTPLDGYRYYIRKAWEIMEREAAR